jgi:catechol-2,3-dioxygenase
VIRLRFPSIGFGDLPFKVLTMPTLKLDHCAIHVSDWERSNAFYHDVLGAELIRHGNG